MVTNETVSRSYFCVSNNPVEHGYKGTPQEIIEKMRDDWIAESPTRSGAWIYCISKDGLHHVHMVIEDTVAMRFSKVKKAYPTAHLEPTKGNKKQVEAYIKKLPPFDENGEKIIEECHHGKIVANNMLITGKGNDLLLIAEKMISDGKTPTEIFNSSICFRKYESVIRKAFFAKRYAETPTIRKVKVIYHIGESGSGKSYSRVILDKEYGSDNIFTVTDFDNNSSGAFDLYCAEPILFIDEFKGNISYDKFLSILDVYRSQIHARYANVYMLWNQVDITSIYPPEELFQLMVQKEKQKTDDYTQLLRRISEIHYHYIKDGEYKLYTELAKDYVNYETLIKRAMG